MGAKVVGTVERGRATCPVHGGDGLSVAFGNGLATCHSGCGGRTYTPLQLVAEAEELDLHVRDDFWLAVERLGTISGSSSSGRWEAQSAARPRAEGSPTLARSPEAVRRIWNELGAQDVRGEAYLQSRALIPAPELEGVLRFNTGSSSDWWLNQRALQGYRSAFAAYRADGAIQTIVLRHCGPGDPPDAYGKAPALPGMTTKGAAILRPDDLRKLRTRHPHERKSVLLVEGPTTWLGMARIMEAEGSTDGTCRLLLGCIGASNAASVVRAFAAEVKGRSLVVALDTDGAGERGSVAAVSAAWEIGARTVQRLTVRGAKDVAELLARRAHVR